ncbi:MAG: thioesterase family protein [Chitinophagaceae bacterium]
MPRIKIDLPDTFSFSAKIPVRITDINYGGHVGNDTILSILHEARIQFLNHHGYSELDCGGAGLIMSDVGIEFKNEVFYGDTIVASVTAGEFSKVAFEIYYKLEKQKENEMVLIAAAKTGMVCYDYRNKKIAIVPDEVKKKLTVK